VSAPLLPPTHANIARAAAALRGGALVVTPTETVYGIAADATNAHAVARLFAAKQRPHFNPLIAHVASLDVARRHGVFHALALRLAEAFWPGPLTLVVPREARSPVAELACAGLATIALRVPAHPVAQDLIAAFGGPLVAPSANRSGRISPTTAAHAAGDLGNAVDCILDAGPTAIGIESSVVAVNEDGRATLLRPGAIARTDLEAIAGRLHSPDTGAAPASPGMLERHYAPRARLRLDAQEPASGEALLGFGAIDDPLGLNLSRTGDLVEAASNLYAHLRALDEAGAAVIAVAPIPAHGLGEAIRNRLERAAAR
jgi:L-threonylcarbamoyladenylate synthase